MLQKTINFVLEKETPGALRYQEVDPCGGTFRAPNAPGCNIGPLYIRKTAFGNEQPQKISITIDW